MKLYFSAVIARKRSGKFIQLEPVYSVTRSSPDIAKLAALHEAFLGQEEPSVKLREKYSHALCLIDNEVRWQYEFPDPREAALAAAVIELQHAKALKRTAASNLRAVQETADKKEKVALELEEATDAVAKAEKKVHALTPKHTEEEHRVPTLDELLDAQTGNVMETAQVLNSRISLPPVPATPSPLPPPPPVVTANTPPPTAAPVDTPPTLAATETPQSLADQLPPPPVTTADTTPTPAATETAAPAAPLNLTQAATSKASK